MPILSRPPKECPIHGSDVEVLDGRCMEHSSTPGGSECGCRIEYKTIKRVVIPGIAGLKRPTGYVRHVAFLAGAKFKRSKRGVPMAILGDRNTTYFGRGNYWALFEDFRKVGVALTPIAAAAWLTRDSTS